jgi:hypothetical protein
MTNSCGSDTAGNGDGGSEIESVLLAYLQRHPQAADTLRGIANWWLPLQRYENGRQCVERALDDLVAAGVLCREQLPDGEMLYTLNNHTKPPQLH